MVADQVPLLVGVGRGIVTLGRSWLTAITFLTALFVACACVAVLQGLMRTQVYAWSPDPTSSTWILGTAVSTTVYQGLLAVLGTWVLAAQFVWYREASGSVVPQGH